jgi:hypothetical protein
MTLSAVWLRHAPWRPTPNQFYSRDEFQHAGRNIDKATQSGWLEDEINNINKI